MTAFQTICLFWGLSSDVTGGARWPDGGRWSMEVVALSARAPGKHAPLAEFPQKKRGPVRMAISCECIVSSPPLC